MNFLLRKDEAEKTYRKVDDSYTKIEIDEMLNGDISKYITIQNIAPVTRDGKEKIIMLVVRPITSPINKTMKLGLLYQTNIAKQSSSVLITDKTTIEDIGTEGIKHGTVELKGSLMGPLVIDVSENEKHCLALKFYVQFEDSNGDTKTIYGPAYIYDYNTLLSQRNEMVTNTDVVKNLVEKNKSTNWTQLTLLSSTIVDVTNSKIEYKTVGNVISFHGKIKILESATSSSEYSISVTNTTFVPSWLTSSEYPYGTYVAGCPDLNGTDDVLTRMRISPTGTVEFLFSSLTHTKLATGQTYIFNFTYML